MAHTNDRPDRTSAAQRGTGASHPAQRDAPELGQLLAQSGGGDKAAFADLYDATATRVMAVALRVLRDRPQAEEVAQEVYLYIWRHATRFDPDRGTALTWILMIAHGHAVSRVRASEARAKREVTYQAREVAGRDGSSDIAYETAVAAFDSERLHGALAALTPLQREAVEMAYLGGYTHSEVAQQVGIPLGTAKTRIRTGLIKLRTVLVTPSTSSPVTG